jgi:hypothetical protein
VSDDLSRLRHKQACRHPFGSLEWSKHHLKIQGFRFEISQDGSEERMYWPDGTLALRWPRRSSEWLQK